MKKAFILIACLLTLHAYSQKKNTETYQGNIIGYWQGVLSAGKEDFHITFNIRKNDKDSLATKMNVKEQGVVDMPMDKTLLKDSLLIITAKAAGIRYEGVFNIDSMKIKGTWKQGGGKFPFTLSHTDTIKVVKASARTQTTFPLYRRRGDY